MKSLQYLIQSIRIAIGLGNQTKSILQSKLQAFSIYFIPTKLYNLFDDCLKIDNV